MADPAKPKLVAQPVDPAKLVTQFVESAPRVAEVRPPVTEVPANSSIELVTVPARKRQGRAAAPWLGWALLGFLLLLATGAAGALIWFRDEPWLTLQLQPTPPADPKWDRRSNRQTQPSQPTPPANPEPIPPNQPLATEPQADDFTPLVQTEKPIEQNREIESNSPAEPDLEGLTGPPHSEPQLVAAEPEVVTLAPQVVLSESEDSDSESDLSGGQRIVVLRLLDLALWGLAAGKPEMAESCLNQAKQISDESQQCEAAIALTQQMVTWQREINTTVTARVPLLTNREELLVDDTIVSLISADGRGLVIRSAGQRREYEADKLPWSLARSVLEVTNSDNPSEDLARKLVTDVLRRRDLSEEANQARSKALQELLTVEWRSTAYPTPAIQNLVAYLDANADLKPLCAVSEAPQRIPVLEWTKWYREVASDLRTNRDLRAKLQDKAFNRFELEATLWSQTDTTKLESITRTILLLQQIALEQQNLAAFLDHLLRIEPLITLSAEHPMWADMSRALLKSKPSDSDLLQLMNQLRTAIDDPRYGTLASGGLSQVGKQLAQRLSDRTQKQEWIKNF
jgi:hypothetical protein